MHEARDLGCFTSSPQATQRSPNYNYDYNAAKTMPRLSLFAAFTNCNNHTTHTLLKFINYNQYHA